jgi:gluconate 2-dehydrogenase gamma chain
MSLAVTAGMAEAWQHAHHAVNSKAPVTLQTLDAVMAGEIEAISSQIIPSDGGPGAREAGVIYFIDRALGTWEAEKLDAYRQGLREAGMERERMFPGSASIASLSPQQQKLLVASIEKSEFFELVRTHTVLGFYGAPGHGGNRKGVGWTHIGFEDRMAFEPPFGFYDAQAMKEGGR